MKNTGLKPVFLSVGVVPPDPAWHSLRFSRHRPGRTGDVQHGLAGSKVGQVLLQASWMSSRHRAPLVRSCVDEEAELGFHQLRGDFAGRGTEHASSNGFTIWPRSTAEAAAFAAGRAGGVHAGEVGSVTVRPALRPARLRPCRA